MDGCELAVSLAATSPCFRRRCRLRFGRCSGGRDASGATREMPTAGRDMRQPHCGGWRGGATDLDGSAWRLACLGFHDENASVGVLEYMDLDLDSSIRYG